MRTACESDGIVMKAIVFDGKQRKLDYIEDEIFALWRNSVPVGVLLTGKGTSRKGQAAARKIWPPGNRADWSGGRDT
jgi:hypothetical protein